MTCKHDWVGDDDCVYCRCEELERQLAEAKTQLVMYDLAAKGTFFDTSVPVPEGVKFILDIHAAVRKWKKAVIEWQDADTKAQDEIERLQAVIDELRRVPASHDVGEHYTD